MVKTSKETTQFGYHLILDAYGCPKTKLNNKRLCVNTLSKLVQIAKMTKLHEPKVLEATGNEKAGGKDPGGFSGFVMIQESHISIHTFAKRGFVTIDLYSCTEFKTKDIIEFLKKTFKPKDMDILKIERGLKYPAENIYTA